MFVRCVSCVACCVLLGRLLLFVLRSGLVVCSCLCVVGVVGVVGWLRVGCWLFVVRCCMLVVACCCYYWLLLDV